MPINHNLNMDQLLGSLTRCVCVCACVRVCVITLGRVLTHGIELLEHECPIGYVARQVQHKSSVSDVLLLKDMAKIPVH